MPRHRPRAGRRRRARRIAGWNLLIAIAGLVIIAGGAELYLRLVWPFTEIARPTVFVPGVGRLIQPGAEVRFTNLLDFWTVQRANSLGFLDREPIASRRAAESCHVAAIGDSFVEAWEVPIADKFHVRLEELAARTLPGLDITTSAWGIRNTGTIAQLPLYDAYARRMKPDLVALVFYANDFQNNMPLHQAHRRGVDPDRLPYATAVRFEDGSMALRPPVAGGASSGDVLRERPPPPFESWLRRIVDLLRSYLRIAKWLDARYSLHLSEPTEADRVRQIERLRRRPHYAWILPREEEETREWAKSRSLPYHLPGVRDYFLDFTAFGIDRFKERADRDGAALVILAFWPPADPGQGEDRDWPSRDWRYKALIAMAEERGVPVIDMHGYIHRQGGDVRESRFAHDIHWNATGHRWAAEALLEWIARNRHVCGAEDGPGIDEPPTRG